MSSCDTFLQGMATGMSGYNPMGGYNPYAMGAGYQVMPGGFIRNTSMDYLLDPNYAIQQVNQQNRQEYLQQTNGGKTMTYEEWYAKIKTPAILSEKQSSSGSSSTRSYSESKIQYGYKDCPHCHGSGKCSTCDGTGLQDKGFGVGKILCGVCKDHNGKCVWCNGTGKRYGSL